MHNTRRNRWIGHLLIFAITIAFSASFCLAQGPGGGTSPLPGEFKAIQKSNVNSPDISVTYELFVKLPPPGDPNFPVNISVGKFAGYDGNQQPIYEFEARRMLVGTETDPGVHTVSITLKHVDGKFKMSLNGSSDVGPNVEFYTFHTEFEINNGIVTWDSSPTNQNYGGSPVEFPATAPGQNIVPGCAREIAGTHTKEWRNVPSFQGDSEQSNSGEEGRDRQFLFGGPNGGGCGSCGSGGIGSPTGIGLWLELMSDMENLVMPTGAGLAYGTNFTDEALLLRKSNGKILVRLKHDRLVTNVHEDDNPTPGIGHDEFKQFKEVRFYNGAALTDELSDVNRMEVEYYDGSLKKYDVKDDDGDKAGDQYAILSSWKDQDGHGIDFNRTSGVVTGPFGETMTINMGTTIAGRDSISSIQFNTGATATFTYTSFYLSKVEITDASQNVVYRWTNDVSVDPVSGGLIWKTDNPATGRRVTLYSPDQGIGGDWHVRSFAANRVVRVDRGADGSEQQSLVITPITTIVGGHYLEYGDDVANVDQRLGQSQKFRDGVSSYESKYAHNVWLDQNGTISISPPEQQWVVGAADYRETTDGVRVDLEYDSDFFLTKKIWGKGESYETFELYQYDALKNLVFYRDRIGNATSYVYDGEKLTEKHVGQLDANGDGIADSPNPAEYAVYKYTYNANDRLEEERNPLYVRATPNLHRTRYEYDGSRRLIKVSQAAFDESSQTGDTIYTYNAQSLVASVTDPVGRYTTFEYDSLGRRIKTVYNDTSTEETLYGTSGDGTSPNIAMKVIATKDRNNVVTTMSYDWLGRMTERVAGAAIDTTILDGVDNLVSDPTLKSVTTYNYLSGLDLVSSQTTNGRKTDTVYDYRMRPVETNRYPSSGETLTQKTHYVNNRIFYTEDNHGRREFRGYREHDGHLMRRIQGTIPTYSRVDNSAVMTEIRDLTSNADFLVADAIKDSAGQLVEVIDGRNVTTEIEYDSRGRQTRKIEAKTSTVERTSETDYDANSNVVEVRSPRYFDSSDTNGFNTSKSTMTYNGRSLQASQTVVLNSSESATTLTEYTADGRAAKNTDARGFDWHSYWHSCCGRFLGRKDPAGHGSFSNADYSGRVTHTATIADYDTHSSSHDPIAAATLNESTTRFDSLGRSIARTAWFNPQGLVDANNVSIAGLNGISETDGSTTQTVYDDNLTDGVGLDSTAGLTVNKLGGGTYSISLANCLTQLADTTANGGAGISFVAGQSAGSAVVGIDAEERLSVTISDGAGRTVMSAVIEPHGSSNPNGLINWSCAKHDEEFTITGFGICLETWAIDALGNVNKRRSDGAGRTLETVDAENNIATAQYDAAGNVVESRDANNIGFTRVYDDLGRVTIQTDTASNVVTLTHDSAGQVLTLTDAKLQNSTNSYDAGGRLVSSLDRNGNTTSNTYDVAGNQLTVVDAESNGTAYEFNSRGQKFRTTLPDHTGGNSGDSSYGIVELAFDAAGRLSLKTDQAGDTTTFNYDMANRLLSRDYRTKANSPSGTIADSDTFTFNSAGQMVTATSGRYSNVVSLSYDDAGRKATESLAIDGQTYTSTSDYDVLGRLAKLTSPYGDETDRTYTARGQLNTVSFNGSVIDTRTYDAQGRLDTSTYGNGVATDYDYVVNDNLVSEIKTTHGVGVVNKIGNYTYSYDANKNKTTETISGAMVNYGFGSGTTYDNEDRLTVWKRDDQGLDQSWSLSAVGDWNSHTINSVTTNRTHNAAHEISTNGSATLQHDVNGNLTVSPGRVLDFDQDNQLVSSIAWSNPSHNQSRFFRYDALHRRVAETRNAGTTICVNSGQQLTATYPSGTAPTTRPTTRFIFGSYIDEPILMYKHTAPYYFHRNQQYSITGCTDSSGEVAERYAYDAYGKTTMIAPDAVTIRTYSVIYNRFMYTGRDFVSSTGLYYFRARWYDAKLGRFVSRDPLEYVDGFSLYRNYFFVRGMDPSGNDLVLPSAIPPKPPFEFTEITIDFNSSPNSSTGSTRIPGVIDIITRMIRDEASPGASISPKNKEFPWFVLPSPPPGILFTFGFSADMEAKPCERANGTTGTMICGKIGGYVKGKYGWDAKRTKFERGNPRGVMVSQDHETQSGRTHNRKGERLRKYKSNEEYFNSDDQNPLKLCQGKLPKCKNDLDGKFSINVSGNVRPFYGSITGNWAVGEISIKDGLEIKNELSWKFEHGFHTPAASLTVKGTGILEGCFTY